MPKHPMLDKLCSFKKGKKYDSADLMEFENKPKVSFSFDVNEVELNTCGICVDDGSADHPVVTFQKAPGEKKWECTLAVSG